LNQLAIFIFPIIKATSESKTYKAEGWYM